MIYPFEIGDPDRIITLFAHASRFGRIFKPKIKNRSTPFPLSFFLKFLQERKI
jgi:hypothetical protein